MIVYPAMDLMDGRCVRLAQGRFDDATTYPADPARALDDFAAAGAQWVHIVDLDGARAGAPRQHDLIGLLAATTSLKVQAAGGIRTLAQAERLLAAGAERVVVGSLAVKQPQLVRAMLAGLGADHVTIALDVDMVDDMPMVAVHGWTEKSGTSLWEIVERFEGRHLLVTDIARDGMLSGPAVDLVRACVARLPDWQVQASGGVAAAGELRHLRDAGAAGAIVGKALWEGRFTLEDALRHAGA